MNLRRLAVSAPLLLAPSLLIAGGALSVNPETGNFFRWESAPVPYTIDRGGLGQYSAEQMQTFVDEAFASWSSSNIPTTSLTFQRTDDPLEVDHGIDAGEDNNPAFQTPGDGISPIIYDDNGSLIATFFGGAEEVVLGFGGPEAVLQGSDEILEGFAILNGRFVDGDNTNAITEISEARLRGTIVHEIGHFLNLDHVLVNDAFSEGSAGFDIEEGRFFQNFPTMYPVQHEDGATLEFDDVSWVSQLYPNTLFQSKTAIQGTVTRFGEPLDGINVVARSVEDRTLALTCVSGFDRDPTNPDVSGRFLIPGLDPGTSWVLDYEPVPSRFNDMNGSGVGTIENFDLNAPVEYINDIAFESDSDAVAVSTTFTPLEAPDVADLNINRALGGIFRAEEEPGISTSLFESAMSVTLIPGRELAISGQAEPEIIGVTVVGVVEDFYRLDQSSPAELKTIELIPEDEDSIFGLWVVINGDETIYVHSETALSSPGGEPQVIETSIDTEFTGDVFIGVDAISGGGEYRLELLAGGSANREVAIGDVEVISPGLLRVNGRGFDRDGAAPEVTIENESIQVNSAEVISDTEVQVSYVSIRSVSAPLIELAFPETLGGYGGRAVANVLIPPSIEGELLTVVSMLLDETDGSLDGNRNDDEILDAADLVN